MQAILTKYLPSTNSRGSRVKAYCQAGEITVPWEYIGYEEEHDRAARALAKKLEWDDKKVYGRMVGGALPDGSGNCYVFVRGK
jgi:hypothetical protein